MGVRGRDNYYYIELSVSHSQDVWQRYGQEMCVCVFVCVCVSICVYTVLLLYTCIYTIQSNLLNVMCMTLYICTPVHLCMTHMYASSYHNGLCMYMYDTHVWKFLS